MGTVRVGSVNGGGAVRRAVHIDYRLTLPQALDCVDKAVVVLEGLVGNGGEAGCDILALPEDSMGLGGWENGHWETLGSFLPEANRRMLDRLGRLAASYNMYLVCCADMTQPDGTVRNTAYLLGRDGREIGRYHKVNLPVQEHLKTPGDAFPVYATPDIGRIGMLVCYDMIFPEAARSLALGGADIIFDPTEGGAAFGGPEISRAAFRTRAVENFTFVVVSWGGWGETEGSLIISPKGEILAEEMRPGGIAVADIDPRSGRQNADWSNRQDDMRARLFRERRPAAYSVLTDPRPPAVRILPEMIPGPPVEIARMVNRATTVGHIEYEAAEESLKAGRTEEAAAAFEKLVRDYPATWFEGAARERLGEIRARAGGTA